MVWIIVILLVVIAILLFQILNSNQNIIKQFYNMDRRFYEIQSGVGSTCYFLNDIDKRLLRQEIPINYEESKYPKALLEKYSGKLVCKKCLLVRTELSL